MPVILTKIYNITGNYTEAEKAAYKSLIDDFRLGIGDDIPEDNILFGKLHQYSDNQIIAMINRAMRDCNCGYPKSNLNIVKFYKENANLLILGATVFSLIREGIFQLRNQIDFNDSGLSIAMFNKTQLYQSWYGALAQQYMQEKQDYKDSIIPSSEGAGFIGISSEFGYRNQYDGMW